ncbi:HlyC/CorC family transporter [Candidatus Woesearchaeota archaeon]|nr:HlyC/CorC family transporter [Candidatus Woesearchaeota archaeon]
MIIKLLILAVLIALSGFFSGTETAFMSLGKFKYKEYLRRKRKNYLLVQKLKENPRKLLSTILIGNNLVNIAAASLATIYGTELFTSYGYTLSQAAIAGIVTGVITLAVLVLGEIMPKTWANTHYEKVIGHSAQIIYIMSLVFTPIIFVLDFITKLASVGHKIDDRITEEEIKTMVSVGSEEGGIDHYEKHLIHKIFQFDDKIVKEIMTPRVKVYTIDANSKIKDSLKGILEEGYSRVPIYLDNPDNIIGIFHIRDVLNSLEKKKLSQSVSKISSKPLFVPESKPIDELFKEMQKKKVQMAIVVDEFGGMAGVVTVEDLLEEIVGEIYDEDDERVHIIRKTAAREFTINGDATLREIKERTKIKLEGLESDTISAFVLEKLGKIPQKDEEIKIKKGKIIVVNVTEKTIESVKLKF